MKKVCLVMIRVLMMSAISLGANPTPMPWPIYTQLEQAGITEPWHNIMNTGENVKMTLKLNEKLS